MTWLRQLLCAINGHPSRETIYDVDQRPSGVTVTTIRRRSCLNCGKEWA